MPTGAASAAQDSISPTPSATSAESKPTSVALPTATGRAHIRAVPSRASPPCGAGRRVDRHGTGAVLDQGIAPFAPQIQAADEHEDRDDVQRGPEDLERQAAVVAEVERLRHQQRGDVPGQGAGGGQGAGLRVDQDRFDEPLGQWRGPAHERRVVVPAGEQRARKGDRPQCHVGRGGACRLSDGYCIYDEHGAVVGGLNALMDRRVTRGAFDSDYGIDTTSVYLMDTVDLPRGFSTFLGVWADYFDYANTVVGRSGVTTD